MRLISVSGSLRIDICAHLDQARAPSESFHVDKAGFPQLCCFETQRFPVVRRNLAGLLMIWIQPRTFQTHLTG
jgi:hypothetical protein